MVAAFLDTEEEASLSFSQTLFIDNEKMEIIAKGNQTDKIGNCCLKKKTSMRIFLKSVMLIRLARKHWFHICI